MVKWVKVNICLFCHKKELFSDPFLKKILFIYIFREREREGERERNIDVWEIHQLVASPMPPAGDPAHNPDMYPDWELNRQPFSLQAVAQATEPHQPGYEWITLKMLAKNFW